MWPATAYSVARENIQEKSSNSTLVVKRVKLHLSHLNPCAGESAFAHEQMNNLFCLPLLFLLCLFLLQSN